MSPEHSEALLARSQDFDPFTKQGWEVLGSIFDEVAPEGGRLLDVGCGTGASATVYATNTSYLVGMDLVSRMTRRAQQRAPDLAWVQGDALHLPFRDESFDVVAFSSVLHHLDNPMLAAEQALRVLRPGGLVFAFDPNLLHPPFFLFRHPKSPLYVSDGVSTEEQPMGSGTLRRAFENAGFTDVRYRIRSGIAYRTVAPAKFDRWLHLYNRLDLVLQRSGLGRWFGSFVITTAHKSG